MGKFKSFFSKIRSKNKKHACVRKGEQISSLHSSQNDRSNITVDREPEVTTSAEHEDEIKRENIDDDEPPYHLLKNHREWPVKEEKSILSQNEHRDDVLFVATEDADRSSRRRRLVDGTVLGCVRREDTQLSLHFADEYGIKSIYIALPHSGRKEADKRPSEPEKSILEESPESLGSSETDEQSEATEICSSADDKRLHSVQNEGKELKHPLLCTFYRDIEPCFDMEKIDLTTTEGKLAEYDFETSQSDATEAVNSLPRRQASDISSDISELSIHSAHEGGSVSSLIDLRRSFLGSERIYAMSKVARRTSHLTGGSTENLQSYEDMKEARGRIPSHPGPPMPNKDKSLAVDNLIEFFESNARKEEEVAPSLASSCDWGNYPYPCHIQEPQNQNHAASKTHNGVSGTSDTVLHEGGNSRALDYFDSRIESMSMYSIEEEDELDVNGNSYHCDGERSIDDPPCELTADTTPDGSRVLDIVYDLVKASAEKPNEEILTETLSNQDATGSAESTPIDEFDDKSLHQEDKIELDSGTKTYTSEVESTSIPEKHINEPDRTAFVFDSDDEGYESVLDFDFSESEEELEEDPTDDDHSEFEGQRVLTQQETKVQIEGEEESIVAPEDEILGIGVESGEEDSLAPEDEKLDVEETIIFTPTTSDSNSHASLWSTNRKSQDEAPLGMCDNEHSLRSVSARTMTYLTAPDDEFDELILKAQGSTPSDEEGGNLSSDEEDSLPFDQEPLFRKQVDAVLPTTERSSHSKSSRSMLDESMTDSGSNQAESFDPALIIAMTRAHVTHSAGRVTFDKQTSDKLPGLFDSSYLGSAEEVSSAGSPEDFGFSFSTDEEYGYESEDNSADSDYFSFNKEIPSSEDEGHLDRRDQRDEMNERSRGLSPVSRTPVRLTKPPVTSHRMKHLPPPKSVLKATSSFKAAVVGSVEMIESSTTNERVGVKLSRRARLAEIQRARQKQANGTAVDREAIQPFTC
jgi:hypothetical protein